MTAFKTIMDNLKHDPIIMSTIREEPLFLKDGREVSNRKQLVRNVDDKMLSVVGKNYKLVQTETVVDRFATSIENSDLNIEGMTASSSNWEIRSIIILRFPKHSIETRKDDPTELQLAARNSWDGSWPFKVDVGGFRIACANGQFDGDFISAFSSRHTRNLTFDGMVDGLDRSLEMFQSAGEKWLSYRKIKLKKDDAQLVLMEYLGKSFEDDEEKIAYLDRKSARRDEIFEKMDNYGKDMGWNLLAAYNAMTDDASHNSSDPLAQFTRGKRLSEVCDRHLELLAA
jgi:hypothetical protein